MFIEKIYRNFFGIYFLFISLYCYPSKDGQHLLRSKRGNLQRQIHSPAPAGARYFLRSNDLNGRGLCCLRVFHDLLCV